MISRATITRCLLMLVVAVLVTSSGAAAAEPFPTTPQESAAPPDGGDPRISLAPLRFPPTTVEPGVTARFLLTVRNLSQSAVDLEAVAIPLEGSDSTDRLAQPAGKRARSVRATRWVTFPGFVDRRELAAGRQLRFPVLMSVPAGARPGTYAIGLAVSQRVSALATSADDSTRVRVESFLTSTAIIRVPGNVVPEARIRTIDAPRLVWSGSPASFEARVENVGDTDLRLDGRVNLDAFLGSAGRTLDAAGPEKGQAALPGGKRDLIMRWSDPPLLGWFRPELVVVGGAGSDVRITRELDTVYVLPPWWLIAALLGALALPFLAMWRRRRRPQWREEQRRRTKARVEQRLRVEAAKRRAAETRRPPQ